MDQEIITSGALSLSHLAGYCEELKAAALGLRQTLTASRRGYFTPAEDDEVRHLLISYWQVRAALLELVQSFRQQVEDEQEAPPGAFLVAYAAAVLLVDAGRFLRETFGESPVVRAKLNEPEPHFGIPTGVYDTVQRSLTNPVNAWHLYHAWRLFGQQEAELRVVAADPLFEPAMAVVDRLGHRLDVSAARYARARLRDRTYQAVAGLRHNVFGRALYGVVKFMGNLSSHIYVRPGHAPQLPAEIRQQLAGMISPGDVFITRKEYAMTNYFLPGYWPHAALYLGDAAALESLGIAGHEHVSSRWPRLLDADHAEPGRVLEALRDGVRIRSLDSPLGSDAIVVLRPKLPREQIAEAISRGMFHEGKPYDYDFDFSRSDRLVCTEVVFRSFDGLGEIRFELIRRAGRLTLSAEDLLRMALTRRGFEPLAVYCEARSAKLVVGADAVTVLRATCAAEGGEQSVERGGPADDSER